MYPLGCGSTLSIIPQSRGARKKLNLALATGLWALAANLEVTNTPVRTLAEGSAGVSTANFLKKK